MMETKLINDTLKTVTNWLRLKAPQVLALTKLPLALLPLTLLRLTLLSLTILPIGLIGCSQLLPEANAKSVKELALQNEKQTASKNELEPIYSFEVLPGAFKFVVKSNGCSHPVHFSIDLTNPAASKYAVSLIRSKKDNCRAMPRLFPIHIPIKHDLEKNAQIILNNPFAIKQNLRARESE